MDWDLNLFEWIQTVTPDQLPAGHIQLHPAVMVLDQDKPRWLDTLKQDAAKGPSVARARTGALCEDLRRVHELVRE